MSIGSIFPPSVALGRLPMREEQRAEHERQIQVHERGLLPVTPDTVDLLAPTGVTDYKVMLNDYEGDCAVAALGHAIQLWTFSSTGKMVTTLDPDTQVFYDAVRNGGQGANMLDCLHRFQTVGLGGRKILGWAAIDPENDDQVHQAVYTFQGGYAGADLPLGATDGRTTWDVPTAGYIGGHAFFLGASGRTINRQKLITWAYVVAMTAAWRKKQMSNRGGGELYAIFSRDQHNPETGLDVNGFPFSKKLEFLRALGGDAINVPPDVAPPPQPTPVPTPTPAPPVGGGFVLDAEMF